MEKIKNHPGSLNFNPIVAREGVDLSYHTQALS